MIWNNSEKYLNLKAYFFLLGAAALIVKLYLNFTCDLIPGTNGGYYPLQIRTIIRTGSLGFNDMPLVFYINVFVLKLFSVFGLSIDNQIIIFVNKAIDSLFIPLTLLPLFKILHSLKLQTHRLLSISFAAFAGFSFSPLVLTSDLQKNALAILLMLFFFMFILQYLQAGKKGSLLVSILFLLAVALSHFGTFIFLLLLIAVFVLKWYNSRAFKLLSGLLVVSLIIIFILDETRFYRLLTIGGEIFAHPAFLAGIPSFPELIMLIFSWILVLLGYRTLRNSQFNIPKIHRSIIFTLMVVLLIYSFPFLDMEYLRRFNLFLYIAQILLIIFLTPWLSATLLRKMSFGLVAFSVLSTFFFIVRPKSTVVKSEFITELKTLKSYLPKDIDKTIIVARHGVEWWVAWECETKIAQTRGFTKDDWEKYPHIYYLVNLENLPDLGPSKQLEEPVPPPNSELVFSSDLLSFYRIQ